MERNPSPSRTAHILVVDDEPDLRMLYELTLLREGYQVESAGSVQEAKALLHNLRFDVVITDMRLPDGLGLELLQVLHDPARKERCIVMTAYGSAENAVEALRFGAFDYLTKPVDLKQFRTVVASAVQGGGSALDASRAMAAPVRPSMPTMAAATPVEEAAPAEWEAHPALADLVGDSSPMRAVKQRIVKVARSMAPVLIRGESGTGKELVARALHGCSHRSEGPWVAVNCGAIPENLLEAEFFGARKGSYTGATQDRQGFFQAAQGGTLFLDEIGELPLAMQSKLLRAIQERCVRPLGMTQEESVDVRIISATHRDLAAEVQAGRFRQDLYYRLNVIEIIVPPLRDRREDLPTLCQALLQRIANEHQVPVPRLTEQWLQALQRYPLHGNVRELENLLHRAMALSEGDELVMVELPSDSPLPPPTAGTPAAPAPAAPWALHAPAPARTAPVAATPPAGAAAGDGLEHLPSDLQAWLDQQERAILIEALEHFHFNRTATAARLGLTLRQIRYRIDRLQIPLPQEADNASPLSPDETASH